MSQSIRQKIAVFDIDGTVFRSSLLIEAFNALVAHGVFPESAQRGIKRDYTAWLDRKGHYDDYLMRVVRVYYRHLKGKPASTVDPILNEVVHAQRNRVYRYTRDLIPRLRTKGYCLIALSNSPYLVVERFASAFAFDHVIGRTSEIKDGIYTGRNTLDGKPFPIDVKLDKPKLLNDFLAAHGIVANLTRSIAVGDSEGDLDILSTVGIPITFNPSSQLARIARRKGWSIVVERKDVMYEIRDARLIVAREHPRARTDSTKRV